MPGVATKVFLGGHRLQNANTIILCSSRQETFSKVRSCKETTRFSYYIHLYNECILIQNMLMIICKYCVIEAVVRVVHCNGRECSPKYMKSRDKSISSHTQ